MNQNYVRAFPVALFGLLFIVGCTVSGTVQGSVSISSNGTTTGTIGGGVTVSSKAVVGSLDTETFRGIPGGGYTVSVSAPASDFSADTTDLSNVTITATTDTGYTSSVTATLQQTSPAISPVNPGDVVVSYALPNTTQMNEWIAQVAANSNSSVSISSSAAVPIINQGNPGTYSISSALTSTTVGNYNIGSASFSVKPLGTKPCVGGNPCPVNPN